MPSFVVLLRGVNVGKAKRVPMAAFKALLLDLGCTRATTMLNSGNAVVDHGRTTPAALATRIAGALTERFGFEVPVVVKTAAEFRSAIAEAGVTPEPAQHPRYLLAFAQRPDDLAALAPLADRVSPPESFRCGQQAAVLYCANGILQSRAAEALLGPLGKAVTTRNWATVLKLQSLLDGETK